MNDKRIAFEMRLEHMHPLKHVNLAIDIVGQSLAKRDIIMKWKKVLKILIQKEKDFLASAEIPDGIYPLVAGFPTGFFTYFFDTRKALSYFQEQEIRPISLPTRFLIRYVDQQQLDPLTCSEDNPKEAPVIVLDCPLFEQPSCISGNLKIAEARHTGKGKLDVYYLMLDDYLPLLFDELSLYMHLFHLDIKRLSQEISPSKLEDYHLHQVLRSLDQYVSKI